MTPVQIAHLAGLVDALGRIRIRETAEGTLLATIAISSPNMPLLQHVAKLTGVRVVRVRRDYLRLGCDEHCDKRHMHVHSDTGRWELVGARAVVVLKAIRPHLVFLGTEVDAVLELAEDAPVKPGTLRKMAALGWSVEV